MYNNYDELYDLVVTKNLSYEECGRIIGMTGTGVKHACKRLGIPLTIS